MQQIIDGKRYDTATAEKIATSPLEPTKEAGPSLSNPARPAAMESTSSLLSSAVKMFYQGKSPGAGDLYRTRKGNWFVHEWETNQLLPVSPNEVKGWCEKFQLYEVVQKHLSDDVEEA